MIKLKFSSEQYNYKSINYSKLKSYKEITNIFLSFKTS